MEFKKVVMLMDFFYAYIFCVLVKCLNCWMKINQMNIGNAICVSFMTIFQQVIVVYVTDLSEFIINEFRKVCLVDHNNLLKYSHKPVLG